MGSSELRTKSVRREFRNPPDRKYGNLDLNHDCVKTAKPTRLKCWDDVYHHERISRILQKIAKEVGCEATTPTTPLKIGNYSHSEKHAPSSSSLKYFKEKWPWKRYDHSRKLKTLISTPKTLTDLSIRVGMPETTTIGPISPFSSLLLCVQVTSICCTWFEHRREKIRRQHTQKFVLVLTHKSSITNIRRDVYPYF